MRKILSGALFVLVVAGCGSTAAPDTAAAMPYGCQVIDVSGNGVDVYATGQTQAACDHALAALGASASQIVNGIPARDGQPPPSNVMCSGVIGSISDNTRALVLIQFIPLCNQLTADGFNSTASPGGNPYLGG